MIDPERHAERRNLVESVLRYIPGFRGYLEKEYRRESDHLARTWLADQLSAGKNALDSYMLGLVDAGHLDALPQFERLRSQIDGLVSSMRGAVRGYSGFFDYVRVNENVLDQVYDHDLALAGKVSQFTKSIQDLAVKADAPAAVCADLTARLNELAAEFTKRGEILAGLDPA